MTLDYTRHYLKWHKNTPDHEKFVKNYYKDLLSPHLPKNKSGLIIDVGCGTGLALDFLKNTGYQSIEGFDTDAGQAKIAAERKLPVKHVDDSIAQLKEKGLVASCILCLDVLEHVPKNYQINFLRAIYYALKPGGRLILTVPNANSALASRWRYIDWTHEASFTEHSLDFVLFNAGFKAISVFPAEFNRRPKLFFLPVGGSRHWWAFRFFRLFRRLEMMAELGPEQGKKVPLSLNLLAVADKAQEG